MAIAYILVITITAMGVMQLAGGRIASLISPHFWAAAILLPVVATFGRSYIVFAAAVIAIVAVAPTIGRGGLELPAATDVDLRARLMTFCLPLMPIMTMTFMVSGLTIVQVNFVGLLAIGFIVALHQSGGGMRVGRLVGWDMLFLLLMAVQFVADARGNDVTFSLRAFVQVIVNLGLPYFAISRAFARVRVPNDLLLALLVSGCVIAVIATFESARHWLLYDNMGLHVGADPELASGYVKERGGWLRGRATFPESTGLSLLLGLLVVVQIALRKQFVSRTALWVMLLMLGCGVFFTLARIGYITIAVGLVAICIGERRWGNLVRLAVLGPIVGGAALVMAEFIPTLAASIGTGDDAVGSVDYRSELLSRGLAIIGDNWATGLSLKDIYLRLETLRQGEGIIDLVNQPLTIFMRTGIIGGVIYFLMFFSVLAVIFIRIPRLPDECRATAVAAFGALTAIIVSLTTTSYGRNEITFIFLLAMGAGVVDRHGVAVATAVRPQWHPRPLRDWSAVTADQARTAK